MRTGLDGLRFLILSAAGINFFLVMGFTLVLPLFQQTEWLGPARYGVAMAVFSASMLVSMVVTVAVPFPPSRRLPLFAVVMFCFIAALVVFSLLRAFPLKPVVLGLGGSFALLGLFFLPRLGSPSLRAFFALEGQEEDNGVHADQDDCRS